MHRPLRPALAASTRRSLIASLVVLTVAAVSAGARSRAPGAPTARIHAAPARAVAGCPQTPLRHFITGRVHKCGTQLYDQQGHRVRFLSIGLSSLEGGDGPEGTTPENCPSWTPIPSYAAQDIKSWGFNSVRLNVSWSDLQPHKSSGGSHHWNKRYLAAVDQAVKSFGQAGVAVILQMAQNKWSPAFTDIPSGGLTGGSVCQGHGMPKWLYPNGGGLAEMIAAEKTFFFDGVGQKQFITAWKFLARRYAHNHHVVGADLLNEAYDLVTGNYPNSLVKGITPKKLGLAKFYTRVARGVHKANHHLMLMFQDHWSKRLDTWSMTARPHIKRGIYVDHFYQPNWYPLGKQAMKKSTRRATKWGFPFWIGEFTAFNEAVKAKPVSGWAADTKHFMKFSRKHDVGWTIWLYGRGDFQKASNIRIPKTKLYKIVRRGM